MGKLLIWAVLAMLALVGWKLWTASQRRIERARREPRPGAGNAVEPMVRCAHCGVHLPASDAVTAAGLVYCCPAHRELGPDPRHDA